MVELVDGLAVRRKGGSDCKATVRNRCVIHVFRPFCSASLHCNVASTELPKQQPLHLHRLLGARSKDEKCLVSGKSQG